MVDETTLCCMCGDVGFSYKLFRCTRCISRFQHTYCGNYYQETSSDPSNICDWCWSEEPNSQKIVVRYERNPMKHVISSGGRCDPYVSDESTKGHVGLGRGVPNKVKNMTGNGGIPSPSTISKSNGRRYKLLKDVLDLLNK